MDKPTYTLVFVIGEVPYTISTAWQSVNFNQFLSWRNDWVDKFPTEADELTGEHPLFTDIEYQLKMLSFQTRIPIEILKQVSSDNITTISETQGFWFEPLKLEELNIVDKAIADEVNIGEAAAEHIINFVHECNKLQGNHILNVMPTALKGYFDIDVSNKPLGEAVGSGTIYGLASFFLSCLASFGLKNKNFYNLNPQLQKKLKQVSKGLRASG